MPRRLLWILAVWGCVGARPTAPESLSRIAPLRRLEVPTVPLEREALGPIPGVRSDRVEIAVAFPPGFDPSEPHPILITEVTADPHRPNVAELEAYAPTALAQGYVVLTAQAIPWPEREGQNALMHRYVSLRAALRWLSGEVPASEHWPLVLAGFSGGAKIVQAVALSLILENRPVAGLFLGGCNEAHAQVLLERYPAAKADFTQIAFYLSAGTGDRIAPPSAARDVADQLRRAGAARVQLSFHGGEHRLNVEDLDRALRWLQQR